MNNLDSILKSRDITLPTKVCLVKAMVFPVVMYGCESWNVKKAECQRIDAFELWCWRREDSWRLLRVPWTARRSNQSILKEISPGCSLEDWCWSWNSNPLATLCEVLTHWKRPWCWEGLGAGGEGDDRRRDGWMASLTQWTWIWVNSGSLWWTGRPGVLWFMWSKRVEHDWATELNWRLVRWFVVRFVLSFSLFVFPLMGRGEWGGNPVCWWLGLYFCFVCCLDEASCTGCCWWLGDAGFCIQVISFVWVLTIWYSLGLVLW